MDTSINPSDLKYYWTPDVSVPEHERPTHAALCNKDKFWNLFCRAVAESKMETAADFKAIIDNPPDPDLFKFINLMRSIFLDHFEKKSDMHLISYTDNVLYNTTLHVAFEKISHYTRKKESPRISYELFNNCIKNSLDKLLAFLSASCMYRESDECYLLDEDIDPLFKPQKDDYGNDLPVGGIPSLKNAERINIIWNKDVFPNFKPILYCPWDHWKAKPQVTDAFKNLDL